MAYGISTNWGRELQRKSIQRNLEFLQGYKKSFYSSTMMNPVEKQLNKLLQSYHQVVSLLHEDG